jgi:hypothetical protein
MEKFDVICIGTGEIGLPLYELVNGVYKTLPIDPVVFPENSSVKANADVVHLCIPGDLPNYCDIVGDYVSSYKPKYVFVHGTTIPGTTNKLNQLFSGVLFVNCPVHGKHHGGQMKKDMLRFKKYISFPEGTDTVVIDMLISHLKSIGFGNIVTVFGTDNTEWLKVLSTTYFGLVIAWAQEVERICDKFCLDYDFVTDIYKHQEDIVPPHFSGQIGGHCVIPNIEIIKHLYDSLACEFIEKSNGLKIQRDIDKENDYEC